jgi:hypothetical protein
MKTNKYVKPSYAVDVWSDHLKSFGLGDLWDTILTGKRGNIPDSKRTNACTLTEDGDLPQSYPTLLDRVKSS